MLAPKIPVDLRPSGVAYVYSADETDRRIALSGRLVGALVAGLTVTVEELNYMDGVTSAIQTQLNAKQAALGFTPATAAQGAKADAALPSASYTAADVLTKIKTVDGAGSGLDADMLDGLASTAFATSAQGTLADNAVPKSAYTAANDILVGTGASAVVKKTPAEIRAILNVADGATAGTTDWGTM